MMKDAVKRPDPSIAARALKEAQERQAAQMCDAEKAPRELGGRGGEDPVRFGDWEIKGIACDF